MIRMIAAVTSNGVMGIDNKLPFNYPADLKHFRTMTLNSTIIMGRKTFESIGKALPKRRNIVLTSTKIDVEGIECFGSINEFLTHEELDSTNVPQDIWFIGGARIYEEGMSWAEEIHLTVAPDRIVDPKAIMFPFINPIHFKLTSLKPLVDTVFTGADAFKMENLLRYAIYKRQFGSL